MVSTINHIYLEDTGISCRLFNILDREGFMTVGDVIKMTDKQLLAVRGIGHDQLQEIKIKIFNEERVLEKMQEQPLPLNSDDIMDVKDFSIRIRNALYRANIMTISALRQTTDIQLNRIRNLGAKSIEIINAAVPDRIRTYEGEAEEIAAQRFKHKIDSDARAIMRFMKHHDMKLADLIKSDLRLSDKRRARQLLTEYCFTFPERIPDVLNHFEVMGDTDDRFYKLLNLAQQ